MAMTNALQEMLGMSPDARPLDLALALERTEDVLHDQARRGSREASSALVRLRLAYLRWAYGPSRNDGAPVTRGMHASG
jgi:hypothetical protein